MTTAADPLPVTKTRKRRPSCTAGAFVAGKATAASSTPGYQSVSGQTWSDHELSSYCTVSSSGWIEPKRSRKDVDRVGLADDISEVLTRDDLHLRLRIGGSEGLASQRACLCCVNLKMNCRPLCPSPLIELLPAHVRQKLLLARLSLYSFSRITSVAHKDRDRACLSETTPGH